MNRRMATCLVVSLAGAILVGGSGLASAQQTGQPSQAPDQSQVPGQVPNPMAQAQDQFQRDKATLADQAHRSVDAANANVDALKKMSKSESGATKQEHEDLANNISMLKGHVNKDIDKMNSASINDWSGLLPVVQRDLSALNAKLKSASSITHVALPTATP